MNSEEQLVVVKDDVPVSLFFLTLGILLAIVLMVAPPV